MKLNVPYGGYLHGLKMFSPLQQAGETKIFGPAYTVQLADATNTSAPKPAGHFADSIEKDSVVFISQPKGFYSACWGGLMSTRAKYLGAKGVVIDGCFRDINEHREMEFPVRMCGRPIASSANDFLQLFAKASSSLGNNTFTRASALNVPVEFTSPEQIRPCTIHPGDLIVADADGVVVIPPSKAEQCLGICEERAKIDELTMEALRKGEEMGATLARLRK